MKKGDILGHEFMSEVMEVGRAVNTLKWGDRVVVPFTGRPLREGRPQPALRRINPELQFRRHP